MHTVTVPLTDKLKQSVTMDSKLRLIAEWNHNRFSKITSVTNPGTATADEYSNDLFPLSSLTNPERPTKGIVKNWAGTNAPDGYVTASYADKVTGARYVTSSPEDKYKYWTSPGESATLSPFAITGVSPTVLYTNAVRANKIRATVENSYSTPSQYSIWITVDGTNWTSVATNPTIGSNGVIELYRQANGTWSSTINRDNALTTLRGVRMVVTNMATGEVRFNLIELGLRLEADLSDYIIDWETNFSMSETSFVTPIGRASSNTASVSLENTTGLFMDTNPSSPYYGLIDKNVEFRFDIGINVATFDAPSYEYIRQFTMRTVEWAGQDREGTNVSLSDASEYLQSIKPNPFLAEERTVGEIIWRLLDSVGFSSWKYETIDSDPSTLVPLFYNNGSETVWEIISQLAEVTQTAIFFDEYGVLQIMPMAQAYNLTLPVAWQFDAVTNGAKLPDIVKTNVDYDFEANIVDITYTPVALKEASSSGIEPMEVVWEPEDETVVLRSSQLVKNMGATDVSFYITPAEAKVWPYSGMVQCEGEFIRYTAKEYSYRNASNVLTKVYIKSEDERIALDKLQPLTAYQNAFTGRFQTSLANRGQWNTQAVLHDLTYSNWNSKRYRTGTGSVTSWAGGFLPQPNDSTLRLKTNSTFGSNAWYVCTLGLTTDIRPIYFGTRFKFENTGFAAAGIVVSAGTNDSGIYIDLAQTEGITPTARTTYGHEIVVHARYSNGTYKRYGKGTQVQISRGVWYDVDVKVVASGASNRLVSVLFNSVPVYTILIPNSEWPDSVGGRHGLYVRGNTSALFEYFYSWKQTINDAFDDAGWWNRIYGGYQSNQYDSELIYGTYTNVTLSGGTTAIRADKNSARRLEEFGPIVHEVREYDIDFTTYPALYSQLYISNDGQVIVPEYNSTPFGAKFILANVSRDNAVVKGEDTRLFGSDNAVQQQFVIYGRVFTAEDDSRKYTVRDDQAVIRRGEVSVEIASKWIQSEATAKKIGTWITYHWSGGSDQVTLTSFGNPLIQIGDVVSINYPDANMAPSTHQYFVVGFIQNYDVEGLSTSYTLRRRKI